MWSDANIVREWKTEHTSRDASATGSHAGVDSKVTSRGSSKQRRASLDSIEQLLNEAEEMEEKRRKEQHAKKWKIPPKKSQFFFNYVGLKI